MKFAKLFQAGRIGPLEVKNRIVFPAISDCYSSEDGYVTERMLDYYEERAKGGAGLVIVGASLVEPRLGPLCVGRDGRGGLHVDEDKFISGLAQLARVIQRHGAKAAIQLAHGGREAKSSVIGTQPLAPSAAPRPASGGLKLSEMPRELTVSEIEDLVTCFAKSAERAKKAGFDGVEIHAGHWYLLGQFLSPEANRRQDAYGGDTKKRMRFLLEIVGAVRQLVGPNYPVWCRINGGGTGMASSITADELREQVQILNKSNIDAISVSGIVSNQPYLSPQGYFVHFAEIVKKVTDLPVLVAGSIPPDMAEKVLTEGKADFINIGRALIADPEMPKKVASGRSADIAPCIRCLQCIHSIVLGLGSGPMKCAVNAAAGREREYRVRASLKAKKVLVIGGGPAGMEVARIAAARNCNVLLYERNGRLGGQLLLASKPPHKELIVALTDYLEGQLRKSDRVEIHLGEAVDAALVDRIKPDAVILATGSVPLIPEIPGSNRGKAVTAEAVLSGDVDVGQRVAVIGGGLIGCETAEFLAEKGKKVTILEILPEMAIAVTPRVREPLLNILSSKGVSMLTGIKSEEITASRIVITDKNGKRQTIEVDTIVLATGAKPDRELLDLLKERVSEIYLAGDCVRPATILEAIHDGFEIGHQI